jgi:hypothetical protein
MLWIGARHDSVESRTTHGGRAARAGLCHTSCVLSGSEEPAPSTALPRAEQRALGPESDPNLPAPQPREAGLPSARGPLAARLHRQLPRMTPFIQVLGWEAVVYLDQVAARVPHVSTTLTRLSFSARCAERHGTAGVKAFVSRDFSAVAAVVVIPGEGPRGRPRTLPISCYLPDSLGRRGVPGPHPCLVKYYYDVVDHGRVLRYFVIAAGTDTALCDLLLSRFEHLDPEPFGVV